MRLIGRGRYKSETYPVASGVGAAFANRYFGDPAGGAPSAFDAVPADAHIVAGVNVTRRASGLFQVNVQLPVSIASANTIQWVLAAYGGSVLTGGVAFGDWLLSDPAIVRSAGDAPVSLGVTIVACPAGGLTQTVTLVGVNTAPLPAGASAIVVLGSTISNVVSTPGAILLSAYELP